MSNFKIGQRVVCVESFKPLWDSNDYTPKVDEIFTIERIISHDIVGFFFKEIPSEMAYEARAFRLLDESFAEEVEANIAKMVEEEQLVEV